MSAIPDLPGVLSADEVVRVGRAICRAAARRPG